MQECRQVSFVNDSQSVEVCQHCSQRPGGPRRLGTKPPPSLSFTLETHNVINWSEDLWKLFVQIQECNPLQVKMAT